MGIMYQRILSQFLAVLYLMASINTATVEQSSITNLQREQFNKTLQNSSQSLAEQPGLISLIVLIAFNIFIFMIVYCCICKRRNGFKVDLSAPRQQLNDRYPRIPYFKTKPHCCTDSESIESSKCFFRYDTITEIPAFIYGDELSEETNVWRLMKINQCDNCRGMTKSIQILKYGKVREFWQVLFLLVISPCFLAFSITQLTRRGVLWVKFFCLQCGVQKRSESPLSE